MRLFGLESRLLNKCNTLRVQRIIAKSVGRVEHSLRET